MRKMLETFNEKDKIELMAINSKVRVVLTSSGFSPDANDIMPDYEEALEKNEGYDVYRLGGGEKVLAVSVPITSMSNEYSAVRMVTSLTEIDNTIKSYSAVVTMVCVTIILIIVITGLYFAGSIVRPIRQISGIARKFALGDFSTRIENDSDDEIGDLCTAINNMADELSATEAMKNEFISSVSHELRTPLTAIKGWAETLMIDGGGSPDTMKKGVGVIVNETERLSQMVEELLDFSRMQSGHFTLQNANMDILAELGDAVLIYSDKARRENQEIIYDEPDMLPFVFGDKNRIRQVFINVIDNALKYSLEGSRIFLELKSDGGNIVFTAKNISSYPIDFTADEITERFVRGDKSRTDGGSGLGLSIAKSFTEACGGGFEIELDGDMFKAFVSLNKAG
jgi:signal transduction histidine kinase